MKSNYILSQSNNSIKIEINHEQPILKIVSAILRIENKERIPDLFTEATISYKLFSSDGKYKESKTIFSNHSIYYSDSDDIDITSSLVQIPYDEKYSSLILELNTAPIVELIIELEQKYLEFDISSLFEDFKFHLERIDNSKVFFSAPFGKGKTTFLNFFFKEYQNQYEVFHLYPVNYSVASNEDIFRYIKAELLLQLLGKEVNFEKYDFTFGQSLWHYFKEDTFEKFLIHFTPLFKCIPKVGDSLLNAIEPLKKLYDSVRKHKEELKVDDKKKALEYIKAVYTQEGSIYEDDVYTQLIRFLVKCIKLKGTKETVFIIDDLDRLDPEHIFRILNVLSAHFDNPTYRYNGDNNKFGFDKIIVTADLSNIYSIYAHKYGSKTDFQGYINKYYSISPYEFDNLELLRKKLRELFRPTLSSFVLETLMYLLELMLESNQFSLRNFITLSKLNIINIQYYERRINTAKNGKYAFFVLIYFLLNIFNDKDILLSIINKCSKVSDSYNPRRNKVFKIFVEKYGFTYLNSDKSERKINLSYNFRGITHTFTVMEDMQAREINQFYIVTDFNINRTDESQSFQFKPSDFLEFLKINIEEYSNFGGLDECL